MKTSVIGLAFSLAFCSSLVVAQEKEKQAKKELSPEAAEVVAAQRKMAEEQWMNVLSGKPHVVKETDNFLVIGNVDQRVADNIAAGAEKAFGQIRKALKIDAKEELWPGKLVIHVAREKNDYNKFVRLVENRSPERNEAGRFAHGRELSYLLVAPIAGTGRRYPLDVEVAQQLAAATLSKRVNRLPDWLVNGFARSVAYRYAPSQFGDERRRAALLVRQGRSAKDAWSGKLAFDEAVVLNASVVDFLANHPNTQKVFADLVAASSDEAGFEKVLETAKLSADAVDQAWRRWALTAR
jgi:hypothetical protein